ncbi:MAG: hypothetical protein FWG78_03825 [Coriobacteriia bacterium]|nr:hypothetical protein [Coriobacteriia bacterium]
MSRRIRKILKGKSWFLISGIMALLIVAPLIVSVVESQNPDMFSWGRTLKRVVRETGPPHGGNKIREYSVEEDTLIVYAAGDVVDHADAIIQAMEFAIHLTNAAFTRASIDTVVLYWDSTQSFSPKSYYFKIIYDRDRFDSFISKTTEPFDGLSSWDLIFIYGGFLQNSRSYWFSEEIWEGASLSGPLVNFCKNNPRYKNE